MKTVYSLGMITIMTLTLAGCAAKLGTSPKGLEIPIEKAAIKLHSDIKDGGYRIVGTDDLKRWLDEGKMLTIISSLSISEDRVLGLLPTAVNVPMPETEKELTPEDRERLLSAAGTDKETPIVLYCDFVACRRSHIGAKLLVDNGYRNVHRYPAGIVGWQEAGYPLKK